uniref:FAS1 domain-containing protein n=1 Tax=Solanum lycopersicum TaxID=4081 RepID=A0A3Q7E890_SOLLC
MDLQIYGFLFTLFLTFSINGATLQQKTQTPSPQINSNSVLVALLDSHYTELSELVEKALLLQPLEEAVTKHNITIFAPRNEALELDLDPEFKRFLLEPGNIKSLQNLLLFHMVPARVDHSSLHHTRNNNHTTLCPGETERLSGNNLNIIHPNDIIKSDGIIHGIQKVLIPKSVQQSFNNRRNLRSISAVLPQGAPEIDPRTNRLKKNPKPVPAGAPPVKDFIQTLLHYGGYNELADILVNLTSLATEMGRLVSEGYVLTVLAPNDEAMAKLTTDQLSEPGAPEQIMYYHLIPEYQTEESMYNSVRRFGKLKYDTLRLPHKVVAEEADGSVKFGFEEGSAYLIDPDIYTDGRISVQGIDGVLFPVEDIKVAPKSAPLVGGDAKPWSKIEILFSIVFDSGGVMLYA